MSAKKTYSVRLSEREIKGLIHALYLAIDYENEYIDAHMDRYTEKVLKDFEDIVNQTKCMIKRYKRLRIKLLSKIRKDTEKC